MSRITVLDGMPVAATMYARALSPRPRPPVSDGLPDRLVNLVHHRCEVAEVAAYDRVCGFTLTDRLPATWLHVLTFPLQLTLMTAADFPLAPLGMVHVGNTMTQHRPVSITEPLELRVRADGLRPHRRGVLVDLVGEALVAGEVVWQGRSSYLNRSATLPGTPPDAEPAGPVVDLLTAGLWRLPSDLGRRYAAVSGDVNPIHLNPLAAKAFGLPGPSPTVCGRTPASWRPCSLACPMRTRYRCGSPNRYCCPRRCASPPPRARTDSSPG